MKRPGGDWQAAAVGCHWSRGPFAISTYIRYGPAPESGYVLLRDRQELGRFNTLHDAMLAADRSPDIMTKFAEGATEPRTEHTLVREELISASAVLDSAIQAQMATTVLVQRLTQRTKALRERLAVLDREIQQSFIERSGSPEEMD